MRSGNKLVLHTHWSAPLLHFYDWNASFFYSCSPARGGENKALFLSFEHIMKAGGETKWESAAQSEDPELFHQTERQKAW